MSCPSTAIIEVPMSNPPVVRVELLSGKLHDVFALGNSPVGSHTAV